MHATASDLQPAIFITTHNHSNLTAIYLPTPQIPCESRSLALKESREKRHLQTAHTGRHKTRLFHIHT